MNDDKTEAADDGCECAARSIDECVCGRYDDGATALRAELARVKSGAKTLGETIEKQGRMVLDATGLHDWIDEDGDGDWGAIWDHLFEMRPTIEALQGHVRIQTHFVQEWKARAEAAEAREMELRKRIDGGTR